MHRLMRLVFAGLCLAIAATPFQLFAADWPQFRGPNGIGKQRVGTETVCPVEIGPSQNVVWKTPLPPGHSSPILCGNRVYLTAVQGNELLTMALDRATGKQLWAVPAAHEKLEKIHRTGSHAQSTPAANAEFVVSFFGSCGLFCYDLAGKEVWHKRMGPFPNDFGAGSSPILVGEKVFLNQDHDQNSALYAFDLRTGRELWKTDRSEFPRNFSTPVIWEVDGRKQIVISGSLRVIGYDLDSGKELWTVRGIARMICATPVVGDDNRLYVSGWANGGDSEAAIRYETYQAYSTAHDANTDGRFTEKELPDDEVRKRFSQIDRDKDGFISRSEYEFMQNLFDAGRNLVMAIRPGGKGDSTATHVAWTYPKLVPFCASPLHHQGLLFTVKDGGILSSLDANTGKPTKQGRLTAGGAYYSSPVTDGRHVYLANERGQLTVVTLAEKWETVYTVDFGEPVHGTPAIADGKLLLRTNGYLYCFGSK